MAKDIDAPIARRLRAELSAEGFDSVAVWGPPTAPSPSELASIERGTDTRAAFRLDETARAVEVWLSAAVGADPVLVDTVRWSGPDDEDAAVVRAVETLHTALLRAEPTGLATSAPSSSALLPPPAPSSSAPGGSPPPTLLLPEPSAPAVPSAPAAVVAPVAAPPPSPPPFARFTFAIGVSAVVSPGGIGPIGDVPLVMAWHPVAAWSIGVRAELPVLSASFANARGSAQAGATLLDVEVARVFGRDSWRVHPDVALGVGATSLHLVGATPSATDLAPTADVWMAAALARAGLAVTIASEWRLRADVTFGATLPEAAINLSGLRVATWGDPFAMAGVAIEFVLR